MEDSNIKLKKYNEPKKEKEEFGGPKGLEPTRYGKETPEWEVKGRVSDF
jgi:hypothetical protein